MSVKEQLINDIRLLPEDTVQVISILVNEFITLHSKHKETTQPIYGSGKGQMWIADDFDAPLEELMEYKE